MVIKDDIIMIFGPSRFKKYQFLVGFDGNQMFEWKTDRVVKWSAG